MLSPLYLEEVNKHKIKDMLHRSDAEEVSKVKFDINDMEQNLGTEGAYFDFSNDNGQDDVNELFDHLMTSTARKANEGPRFKSFAVNMSDHETASQFQIMAE